MSRSRQALETAASALGAWFAQGGLLSRIIDGYTPRAAQVEMAEAVAETLDKGGVLVAEAGTGTGKTFAYLLPALLSGRQVVVATGSRNLQDQLFGRDLPVLQRSLGRPLRVVQLKGRGNYLCHYRLQQALEGRLLHDEAEREALLSVRRWLDTTAVGDIAELAELPEDWWGWQRLTSTEDSCLGQDCPFIADCFLLKARRRALEADLVVVNHHLLCADWALRQEGYGALLPEADAVIVDEAHQFAATAAHFLGETLSARQLQELLRDTVTELRQAKTAAPALRQAQTELQQALQRTLALLGTAPSRGAAEDLPGQSHTALAGLAGTLAGLVETLAPLAGASQGLGHCYQRAERQLARLQSWLEGEREGWVRWFETGSRRFALHATPLAVGASFAAYRARFEAAWIFTSATLSVAGGFDHFLGQLGLSSGEVRCRIWPSPFDYPRQALLYLPPGLPPPAAPDYTRRMIAAVRPVLEASGGRAFLLFTSHRALNEAAKLLEDLPFPLLVQGRAPKAVLLARFRELGNAVLLGTASFWEGVDVRGSALSCVIIDKLPFTSPGDPVCQARLASLRARGYDPFPAWQLPAAVIALKQGAGRLIRGAEDRGVLVLCDPRLTMRGYGKVFLDSLPPMPRTRELQAVRRFFGEPT
ncbi:ATP-dependent DNA helicase DinG [Methylomarinovum caldicuralii]|uniref:DNA 5'-3' helicase n=1 Tax=Methylomarinovum caldicuralii TaxID=438856 RepID=A0AAU9CSN8_9GAMM|nr:ATP-dependent DNA helicase [Methylomarinovum caldicuralii]BCX83018.1 ATP-dependent DNA helicase DinG [Methylomarinovum caldicuralii]